MHCQLFLTTMLFFSGGTTLAIGAQKAALPEAGGATEFRQAMAAKLAGGNTDEAIAFFKDAMRKARTTSEKKSLREEFLRGMADAGKPLQAYQSFPGGKESFAILAEQLVASGQSAALGELLTEHATFFDDDPYLAVYRGQLAFEAKKYAEADAHWTAVFRSIDDEYLAGQFQHRRIQARHGAGNILGALIDIPATTQSFKVLADLCLQNRQHAELEKLLNTQAPRNLGSYAILRYRLLMHPEADYATLQKMGGAANSTRDITLAHLMVNKGRALEAYKAAADPRVTFRNLGRALLSKGDFGPLRQLIELHRKADPNDGEVDSIEAELLVETNQLEKAIACVKKAKEKKPPRPDIVSVGAIRLDHQYIEACYVLGQGLTAYEDLGRSETDFRTLARLYMENRDADGLAALLKARPAPGGAKERRLWIYQANLKMLAGKSDEAIAMLVAHRTESLAKKPIKGIGAKKDLDQLRKDRELADSKLDEREFTRNMAQVGQGLAVYGVAAHPEDTFLSLAQYFRREKDADSLAQLIAAHRPKFPNDPELPLFSAWLELMRGNASRAEEMFRVELGKRAEKQPDKVVGGWTLPALHRQKNLLWEGLRRAVIRQGKTVERYRVTGGDPQAFREFAALCVQEKAGNELEALLAVHRKHHPMDAGLRRYEGELAFLKGDYEAAYKVFKIDREEEEEDLETRAFRGGTAHKAAPDDYSPRDKALVCLVRLKRNAEAVKLAADWELNAPSRNAIVQVLPYAAAQDVSQTMRLMRIHAKRLENLQAFYRNADLGPLLLGEALREVGESFPNPAKK